MFPTREEIAITLDNALTAAMNLTLVAAGSYVFLAMLGVV
jgi:hypothetical protein